MSTFHTRLQSKTVDHRIYECRAAIAICVLTHHPSTPRSASGLTSAREGVSHDDDPI